MLVAAIDVGSPKNVGWATNRNLSGCGDLTGLLESLCSESAARKRFAIGFEAPLWVPRSRDFKRMTANRGGIEAATARPWSAGAGCGALASGVANFAWLFEALASRCGALSCTTQLDRFTAGQADVFVWEAFVSGKLKATSHEGDAESAVRAFEGRWPELSSAIAAEPAVNLAASCLLATGHNIPWDELGKAGMVVAPLPATEA